MKNAVCHLAALIYYAALSALQEMGTALTSILAGSGDGGTIVSTATGKLNELVRDTVIPAAQGVGLAIAVTFFLVALIELMQNDRLTIEQFIKFFSKLIISVALIYIAPDLFEAVVHFGDGLAAVFASIGTSGDMGAGWPTQEAIEQAFITCANLPKDDPQYMHWITILMTVAFMAVPMMLVATILKGCCYVIAFTRMLELTVRGSFLPVAFGLISDDGWRGAGGRYIRKFIAVCSQSAVLVVIGQLTEYVLSLGAATVMGSFLGPEAAGVAAAANPMSMGGILVLMIGIAVASVTMMFKSIGIINDVFGG